MATISVPAQTGQATPGQRPVPPAFDSTAMEPSGSLKERAVDWLLRDPCFRLRWAERLFRPIARHVFHLRTITAYDEVREVLGQGGTFPVPWTDKMKALTDDINFVLGMPRDAAYQRQYGQIARAFPMADVASHVEAVSWDVAHAVASRLPQGKPFDAVELLVMGVPAAITESYYGVRMPVLPGTGCPDDVLFTRWTLAASSYVFGAQQDAARTALGLAGAAHLSLAIRDSIAAAQAQPAGERAPVMAAMLAQGLDPDTMHAILFGMVLGFIPTDVLAGGNILETLLRNEEAMRAARAAAAADDDLLLWKCLRETLRFRHINPGPLRTCAQDYVLNAGKRWKSTTLRQGESVWAMTQLAMFDPKRIERPRVFDPQRPDEHYMIFGVGQHWCVGAYIAQAQITQTFKALLRTPGALRVAGGGTARARRYMDFYPLHLDVELVP